MADAGCEVLFLADRIAGRSAIQPLRRRVEGLEKLGHDVAILCLSARGDHGLDDLTECPGLGRRWLRPWVVRGLGLGERLDRGRLIHVLSGRMAEAALAIAERWRIPYLLGVDEFPGRDFRLRLSRDWCRGLVVANRELAAALTRDFGVPSRLMHEIVGGVSAPIQVDRPDDQGRVAVVGAAGPLTASSGFATFLTAARKVVELGHDVEFLIAGQGEDEGDLRRKAERLRIAERLTFADDLPVGLSFWQVLDVYCQTSMTPTAGGPLMMAMASGVPSISTDVEGLRSLILPGETGLIVPRGDSEALAAAIVELLADRDRASSLGEAARGAAARDFDPDREVALLDALYRKIAGAAIDPGESGPASRVGDFKVAKAGDLDGDPFPRLSRGS